MNPLVKPWIAACVAAAAAALLAGCGGGDEEAPTPAAQPGPLEALPAAAGTSAAALVGYLGELRGVNEQAEGVEPVALDAFTAPEPDDTEPEPLA